MPFLLLIHQVNFIMGNILRRQNNREPFQEENIQDETLS